MQGKRFRVVSGLHESTANSVVQIWEIVQILNGNILRHWMPCLTRAARERAKVGGLEGRD